MLGREKKDRVGKLCHDVPMQTFNSYIIRHPSDESSATCPKCMMDKPLPQYYRHSERGDGAVRYRPYCKDCRTNRPRQQKSRPVHSIIQETGLQACRFCHEVKPLSDFYANGCFRDGLKKYRSRCKSCILSKSKINGHAIYVSKAKKRSESHKNFISGILNHAAKRKQNLGFNIDLMYILSIYDTQCGKCALSGVDMTFLAGNGRVQTNISIDRIDSSKGYIRGNVQLVCNTVNRMKQDMTEVDFRGWCRKILERANA